MKCVSVKNVKLGPVSLAAIEEIREKRKLFNALEAALPAGVMTNIFLGNGALKSSYNITQTDFELLIKAVSSLRRIEKAVIKKIALMAAVDTTGTKESRFWEGVAYGCE